MVILFSLPVARSFAATCTMPFASMSNVTSICGTPRGAGGMPSRWKRPRVLLSRPMGRSPWRTCTSTLVCPSAAVENTSLFRVGMVVLRGISGVATPPSVSMLSVSGVTSSSRMSFTSPERTPACTAAPIATTSSGFTDRLGSLPKYSFTICWIFGTRVDPPTSTTSSISLGLFFASARHFLVGSMARWKRSSHICSNFARDSFFTRCLGPV